MRLRLRFETAQERWTRRTLWHRWFAWHPVEVSDGEWWWLETVERRECYQGSHAGGTFWWEYRVPHFKGLLP